MITTSSFELSGASRRRVPFLDVGATYRELKDELDKAYRRVMEGGW